MANSAHRKNVSVFGCDKCLSVACKRCQLEESNKLHEDAYQKELPALTSAPPMIEAVVQGRALLGAAPCAGERLAPGGES
jgi:hypothetical protein